MTGYLRQHPSRSINGFQILLYRNHKKANAYYVADESAKHTFKVFPLLKAYSESLLRKYYLYSQVLMLITNTQIFSCLQFTQTYITF